MKRLIGAAAGTAAVIAAVAGVVVLPSAAADPPPPIASEPLTSRSVFPDDVTLKVKIKLEGRATKVVELDPTRTVTVRYTVQPGAQFPWHSHAGPVFVNVVQGAITYLDGDTCSEHTYGAGQAFVDPGQGHVHTAYNRTNGVTVFVATFFGAPAEGSLLIPAPPTC